MIIYTNRMAWGTIEKVLSEIVEREGKRRFVIYTNGMGGALVKEYLEVRYSIIPEYTIDNKVNDGTTVLSLEQAKRRNNEGVYFLICSWNADFYWEIRHAIYDTFPREQIIDIFPGDDEWLPTEEEICKTLKYVEGYTQ